MSRRIKMTEADVAAAKAEFEKEMAEYKAIDGDFVYRKSLGFLEQKANLKFTEKAYLKMNMLVREFDKEVAWHGIAKRGDGEFEYIVSDILVYPQEVTGVTVTTNQEKYQKWLMECEDEVFDNIRMQGHSHVDMGVTPSAVDRALYKKILDQLEKEMFYIFLIWNKRGDRMIEIYDLASNIFFENRDVNVDVLDDEMSTMEFMNNARRLVQNKKQEWTPVESVKKNEGEGFSAANSGKRKMKKMYEVEDVFRNSVGYEPECDYKNAIYDGYYGYYY